MLWRNDQIAKIAIMSSELSGEIRERPRKRGPGRGPGRQANAKSALEHQ